MNNDEKTPIAQSKRIFVVLNPVAGTSNPDETIQTITKFCEEHSWECEIYTTKKDEDLRQLVRNALKKGVDMVVAAGGDGTVSAVVDGMVNSKIPMGILPAGTGNALARDRSIPIDLKSALELLGGEHDVHQLDAVEVVGKGMYVMNVSVGITSITMSNTAREEKRRFGFLAYIYRAFGSVIHSDLHRFQVKADDFPLRFAASEVFIANCKFAGLQPQMNGVEISPYDSRLDMFVIRAQSIRDYLSVFAKFITFQKHNESDKLYYIPAKERIVIESEFPLPVQADGEELGMTPVEIRLIPKALHLIVPCEAKT
jgi:YegS/Rv2252/BmrU family lipid kinase